MLITIPLDSPPIEAAMAEWAPFPKQVVEKKNGACLESPHLKIGLCSAWGLAFVDGGSATTLAGQQLIFKQLMTKQSKTNAAEALEEYANWTLSMGDRSLV